ncbi:MAG: hypothetical protein M1816_005509 [Peltula sp. TS41687]|nr:MAG: hypothetical protein M1816_005509 [Peltula sp. TS41687]
MLRCNSLPCRTELHDRAVVTTCSHIFCISCSQNLGLSNSTGDRICPACDSSLPNPDDAVSTILNPTEDYKTSVLSGLSPTIIVECASRGLSFWSYQSTQEIIYQEYLARTLREKHESLKSDMDKFTRDANSEIGELQNKLSSMQLNHNEIQKKNHELAEALREKTKKLAQTQELYNKLKRRTLYSRAQAAASNAADQSFQGDIGVGEGLPDTFGVGQNEHRLRAPMSPERQHIIALTPMVFGAHRREMNLNGNVIGLDGATRPSFPRAEAGWTGIGGQVPRMGTLSFTMRRLLTGRRESSSSDPRSA